MKIVVAGGTGLIGSAVVEKLFARGHYAVAASLSTGVDVLTGEGLAEILQDAEMIVDTLNPRTDDPDEIFKMAGRSGRILVDNCKQAGVKRYVALSALGADRLSLSPFFLGKLTRENLIRTSGLDFTIVRSAPFFESIYAIVNEGDAEGIVRLPPVAMQPIAADDVATALTDVALAAPENDVRELIGPETYRLTDLALQVLTAYEEERSVVSDKDAAYFGAPLGPEDLLATHPWRVASTRFDDWLRDWIASA